MISEDSLSPTTADAPSSLGLRSVNAQRPLSVTCNQSGQQTWAGMIAFSPPCVCVKILYPELVKEFEKTCCLAESRSTHSDCITSRHMTSETSYAMLKYRLYTTNKIKLRSKTLKWAFLFHWCEGSKVFPQTVAKTSVLGGSEERRWRMWKHGVLCLRRRGALQIYSCGIIWAMI